MIATWMLYCALCALGLSFAAVWAERVLLAARGPVRFVWVCAIALSVVVPVAAYRLAPRVAPRIAPPVADVAPDSIVGATVASGATAPLSRPTERAATRSWRTAIAAADAPLSVAWATLSAALLAHFVCGVVALAWMRRWWRRDTVLGIDVLVSEATGPALVGAVSPAIVVPEWTLSMDAAQVALMLRHEEEHRRAHDGQLLTAAQFALMVMPWNAALWWLLLRLRVAVELDCDARVLRHADARSYGDLLLEMARPRRRLMLLGATAFAERASQLERRIRAIGMRRGVGTRSVRVFAISIGVAAVSLAWVAPRPAVPPLPIHAAPAAALAPRSSDPLVSTRAPSSSPGAPSLGASVTPTGSRSPVAPQKTARPDSAGAKRAVARDSIQVPPIPPIRDGVALPTATQPPPPPAVRGTDSLFERLFAGISLTPDQEAAARAQIIRLQLAQQAQMAAFVKTFTESLPLRMAIQAQADSALLGLLTNEDDRAVVRARFVPQVPGGRGRSGGPGTPLGGSRGGFAGDTLIAAGRAGVPLEFPPAGGGRGARVGGGGGGRGAASVADAADNMLRRLFNGVELSPEQESGARTIITKMQADLRAVGPAMPSTVIAARPFLNQIVMSPESAASLAAILTNDGDRATLESRIIVEVVRVPSAPPTR